MKKLRRFSICLSIEYMESALINSFRSLYEQKFSFWGIARTQYSFIWRRHCALGTFWEILLDKVFRSIKSVSRSDGKGMEDLYVLRLAIVVREPTGAQTGLLGWKTLLSAPMLLRRSIYWGRVFSAHFGSLRLLETVTLEARDSPVY